MDFESHRLIVPRSARFLTVGAMNDGIRAVWMTGHVDWYVGYSAADWDGLVTDPITTGVAVPNAVNQRGRDSIGFNSWNIGGRWRFGKGK